MHFSSVLNLVLPSWSCRDGEVNGYLLITLLVIKSFTMIDTVDPVILTSLLDTRVVLFFLSFTLA